MLINAAKSAAFSEPTRDYRLLVFFYLGYTRGKLKPVVFSLVGATFGHDEIYGAGRESKYWAGSSIVLVWCSLDLVRHMMVFVQP